jgi:hypothetical protein
MKYPILSYISKIKILILYLIQGPRNFNRNTQIKKYNRTYLNSGFKQMARHLLNLSIHPTPHVGQYWLSWMDRKISAREPHLGPYMHHKYEKKREINVKINRQTDRISRYKNMKCSKMNESRNQWICHLLARIAAELT